MKQLLKEMDHVRGVWTEHWLYDELHLLPVRRTLYTSSSKFNENNDYNINEREKAAKFNCNLSNTNRKPLLSI